MNTQYVNTQINMNTATSTAYTTTQPIQQPTQCSSPMSKLVIFDWDDTIFPTTAVIRNKEDVAQKDLEAFGHAAYSMLLDYVVGFGAGNVYIVTNGKQGWVEKSLCIMSQRQTEGTNYWVQIQQLLTQCLAGRVISAQTAFGAAYPNQTALWKTLVFQTIARSHFSCSGSPLIVSIGDSTDEFIASGETQKMLAQSRPTHLIRLSLQKRSSRQLMVAQFAVLRRVGAAMLQSGEPSSFDVKIQDFC